MAVIILNGVCGTVVCIIKCDGNDCVRGRVSKLLAVINNSNNQTRDEKKRHRYAVSFSLFFILDSDRRKKSNKLSTGNETREKKKQLSRYALKKN